MLLELERTLEGVLPRIEVVADGAGCVQGVAMHVAAHGAADECIHEGTGHGVGLGFANLGGHCCEVDDALHGDTDEGFGGGSSAVALDA